MNLTSAIKKSWKKNKVETSFMGAVILFTVLSYFRPDYTGSLLANLGLTLLNFTLLALVGVGVWYFFLRK